MMYATEYCTRVTFATIPTKYSKSVVPRFNLQCPQWSGFYCEYYTTNIALQISIRLCLYICFSCFSSACFRLIFVCFRGHCLLFARLHVLDSPEIRALLRPPTQSFPKPTCHMSHMSNEGHDMSRSKWNPFELIIFLIVKSMLQSALRSLCQKPVKNAVMQEKCWKMGGAVNVDVDNCLSTLLVTSQSICLVVTSYLKLWCAAIEVVLPPV